MIDENLKKSIKLYFLEKKTKEKFVSLTQNIFDLLRFSIKSLNPINFLKINGIIIFSDSIAFNTLLLSNILNLSRNTLFKNFKKEDWDNDFNLQQKYRFELYKILLNKEIKHWIIKKIPKFPLLNNFLNSHQNFIHKSSNNIQIDSILTFQKNVFSWTFP